jgi:hypothetical protein
MRYGCAIVWKGPNDDPALDIGYTMLVHEAIVLELARINVSLKEQGLPRLEFLMVARDENTIKKPT